MSTEASNPNPGSDPSPVVKAPASAAALEAPMLTITQYQQLAEQFRLELARVSAMLPPLEEGATAESVRSHLNVPRPFLDTVISGVERHHELQAVGRMNPATSRESLQYNDAFKAVLDDVLAFASRVALTLQSRHSAVSRDALQMYDIAKGVARDGLHPELAATVASMKRDLGRRGGAPLSQSVRKAAREAATAARNNVLAAARDGGAPPEVKAA